MGRVSTVVMLCSSWALGMASLFIHISTTSVATKLHLKEKDLAVLPVAVMYVSVAVSSPLWAALVHRFKKKYLYVFAALLGAIGNGICAGAIYIKSFPLMCVGMMFQGCALSTVYQYRYATTHILPPKYAKRGPATVMMVGAIGGIMGAQVGEATVNTITDVPFVGPYVFSAMFFVLDAILLCFINYQATDESAIPSTETVVDGHQISTTVPPQEEPSESTSLLTNQPAEAQPRSIWTIIKQPVFLRSVLLGTVSYMSMATSMSAVPLAMNIEGFELESSTLVIDVHVICMLGPALLAGFAIERFGCQTIMICGIFTSICGCLITWGGDTFEIYIISLIIIGIGWCFAFIATSTMIALLPQHPLEHDIVHSAGDLTIFTGVAIGAVVNGFFFVQIQWHNFMTGISVLQFLAMLPLSFHLIGRMWRRNRNILV